ncbi:MAG: hypothetical protein J4F45_08190 [Pseudomonadales bacterium]|nr:hypothetical protein [Pseudomonadales bacterium]
MFQRVLISNRGEIAIRIAKAASDLGVESVGVFSPVDALSLHTRIATVAFEIGNGAADDPVGAYLDAEALVSIAKESGCDCVHPGYGFLAENAGFADRCAAAGRRRCPCSVTRSAPARWRRRSAFPSCPVAANRWHRRIVRRPLRRNSATR